MHFHVIQSQITASFCVCNKTCNHNSRSFNTKTAWSALVCCSDKTAPQTITARRIFSRKIDYSSSNQQGENIKTYLFFLDHPALSLTTSSLQHYLLFEKIAHRSTILLMTTNSIKNRHSHPRSHLGNSKHTGPKENECPLTDYENRSRKTFTSIALLKSK